MARILIAGGSLGGLLAANMLLRDGHDVQVIEKAAGSLDGRGAGIVTHAALGHGLVRAGVTVDATLGVHVASRVALDAGGAVVARLAMPQVLTSWSRLYALLSAAGKAADSSAAWPCGGSSRRPTVCACTATLARCSRATC